MLSRLGLHANNDELELLTRKFDDNGDGFVNYVEFSCAVDPEEHASNRETNSRSAELASFKANGNFKTSKVADVQPGRPPVTSDFPSLRSSRPSDALEPLMRRLQESARPSPSPRARASPGERRPHARSSPHPSNTSRRPG